MKVLSHSVPLAASIKGINIGSNEINGSQISDKNDYKQEALSGISNNNIEEDSEEEYIPWPTNANEKLRAVQEAL